MALSSTPLDVFDISRTFRIDKLANFLSKERPYSSLGHLGPFFIVEVAVKLFKNGEGKESLYFVPGIRRTVGSTPLRCATSLALGTHRLEPIHSESSCITFSESFRWRHHIEVDSLLSYLAVQE